LWKLFLKKSEAIVSSIDGKFSLPVSYLAARLKGVPFLLWTGIWSRVETPFHKLFFPVTRYFYRHADAVIVYGEHVKRYLLSEGVPSERIFVARHSVDNRYYSRAVTSDEKMALRERLGISLDKKIVLFLGRLEEVKGARYLIEAFARLKPQGVVLVIAGEGSHRAQLEKLARNVCPARSFVFAGYVPIESSVAYYGIAHVCVIPSITTPAAKELWGLVANEAFNQGVPVIATDAVGAAAGGFIVDSANGFVVPERDSAGLAQALDRILLDDSLRERLSAGARATVEQWTHQRMEHAFVEAAEFACREPLSRGVSRSSSIKESLGRSHSEIVCPLCQKQMLEKHVYDGFRRCARCALILRYPIPKPQELDALYRTSWSHPEENVRETGGTTPELARDYAAWLTRSLKRRDLSGLKILEYGAGRGEMLTAMQTLGADLCAVEPYGGEYLQQRGFRAYRTLRDLPQDLRFDGIVSVDVFEHDGASCEIVRDLGALLKPSGWLFVATPNPAGLNARIFRARWREAQKPGHVLFFEPGGLESLFRRTGFQSWRRLHWRVRYEKSAAVRAKDFLLGALRLDGELRYLAFRTEQGCP
jgi:glycosyltransferase involved in cell wall biosynthesis/SAM-dependent methyltransferase